MSHVEKAVEVLNRALDADRVTVSNLLLHMFSCNERMSASTPLHTWKDDGDEYWNALAVINSLFAYGLRRPVDHGPIVATFSMLGDVPVLSEVSLAEIVEEEPTTLDMADHTIFILNNLLAVDPIVISQMMDFRLPCSQALADDPTIQVALREDGTYAVCPLGIINGLLGIDDRGYGPITGFVEDDGVISRFEHTALPPTQSVAPRGGDSVA